MAELEEPETYEKPGRAQEINRELVGVQERLAELQQAAGKDKEGKPAGSVALDSQELIRQAYLRTVKRLPTPDETDRCTQYLAEAQSPAAGAKGLLWALINTKEFIVNH